MASKKAAAAAEPGVKDAPDQPVPDPLVVEAAVDEPVVHVPLFDPAVHTDPNQLVYLELYCLCGSLLRQRDPVWAVEYMAGDFIGKHTGDGHGPASKAACIKEREAVREAAFRMAGRAAEYRPKPHPNLDVKCRKARPWPVLVDASGDAPVEG